MKYLVVLFAACSVTVSVGQVKNVPAARLTGSLRWDLLGGVGTEQAVDSLFYVSSEEGNTKSVFRAALYSAVIPGAGEWYAESYWQAVTFLGAEVALWIIYAVNTSRGDRETEQFERYADQHWSVARFAEWIELNSLLLNPDVPACTGIVVSSDPNLSPWERVDWDRLNECEGLIGTKASTGFSHRLPRRPAQQYYELIGKYLQYNAGWDDWGVGGPSVSEYLLSPSPRFRSYSEMRGRANDFYNIATTASFVLVANHVLSALDAAWSASRYNKTIAMKASLQPISRGYGFVEFVPTASVRVIF